MPELSAPGDFSKTRMKNVQKELSQLWTSNNAYEHLQLKENCFNDITANQSIRWVAQDSMGNDLTAKDYSTGEQCQVCEVWWLQDCLPEVKECSDTGGMDACTPPESTELQTGCETYSTDCLGETDRMIKDLDCANYITSAQREAQSINGIQLALDQALIIGGYKNLIAEADELTAGMFDVGSIDPTDPTKWVLGAEDLNAHFIACLKIYMRKCGFVNPKIISGEAWAKILLMANKKSGNGCCDYDALIKAGIGIKEDVVYLDPAIQSNPKDKHFFLVDLNDLAFINTPCWANSIPQEKLSKGGGKRYVFSLPSGNLSFRNAGTTSAVRYDYNRFVECCGEKNEKVTLVGRARGNWLRAPGSCVKGCAKVIHFVVKG